MKYLFTFCIMLLACSYYISYAQDVLPRDDRAAELIYDGKRHLNYRQFNRAARSFESASQRPFNRSTTTAIYLAGLAYYYDGDFELAHHKFQTIIDQFPRSRYLEDAKYHQALLWLKSARPEYNTTGLKGLLNLIDEAYNVGIARDAYAATQNYLFYECSPDYLEELLITIQPQHKLMVMEALCRQKIEVREWEEARELYIRYLGRGGEDSPYLSSMFERRRRNNTYAANNSNPGLLKVALMLPLHLDDELSKYSEDIPQKSKSWLEFYEGFKLGMETSNLKGSKRIQLKVLDTRRDSLTTENRLYEVESFSPNLIVGDIFNKPSEIISNWAESRGIPQMIPLSPTFNVQYKNQTFLAHPDLETRATRMAEYASEVLGLEKVVVWTNQKKITETFANAFISTFDTLGGEAVRVAVDSIYDKGEEEGAKYEIPKLVHQLKFEDVDGVYIPISNEAISGLILTQLAFFNWKPKVMGTSHWKHFDRIDRELKEKYGVLFTNTNHFEPSTAEYQTFYEAYLKEYNYPPSDFCLLGYDLAMYIMNITDLHDNSWGMPLSAYIRAQPEYEGIHLNYYFDNRQVNQFVNISEYHETGIRKVNGNKWRQWEFLDDWRRIELDSLNRNRRDEAYFLRKEKER